MADTLSQYVPVYQYIFSFEVSMSKKWPFKGRWYAPKCLSDVTASMNVIVYQKENLSILAEMLKILKKWLPTVYIVHK